MTGREMRPNWHRFTRWARKLLTWFFCTISEPFSRANSTQAVGMLLSAIILGSTDTNRKTESKKQRLSNLSFRNFTWQALKCRIQQLTRYKKARGLLYSAHAHRVGTSEAYRKVNRGSKSPQTKEKEKGGAVSVHRQERRSPHNCLFKLYPLLIQCIVYTHTHSSVESLTQL